MSVDEDARAFGQHFKQGGWRLAFIVARCCDPTSKGGRPSQDENCSRVNGSEKVSFRRFAEMAGVSPATVLYHYKAWQLAAEEGHCTPAVQLRPDSDDGGRDDLGEGDEEDRKLWLKFYRQIREPQTGGAEKDRTQAGRSSSSGRKSRGKANSAKTGNQSDSTRQRNGACSETDSTSHPLYGLLLDLNQLTDELKRGNPAASVISAAEKVADAKHRAALRRFIGVL